MHDRATPGGAEVTQMPLSKSPMVDIFLATFNGERFLAQQLDSILRQSYTAWRVLISDDGSADATVAIATAYADKDERISVVNTARQGGVVVNFQKALQYGKADYLMFCDQDDVWAVNKVEIMLSHMLEQEAARGKDLPILGFSDLAVVDSQLTSISPTFYNAKGLNPANNLDYRYLLWSSTVYGCTVIFNAALKHLADPIPARVPMHDQWCALLAALTGVVFHVNAPTILYRQHAGNVVGAKPRSFLQRIVALKKTSLIIRRDVDACRAQLEAARRMVEQFLGPMAFDKQGELPKVGEIGGRIRFVMDYVVPFARERKVYAMLFAVIFVLRKYEK
jgi:hypothetical protein